MQLLFLLSLLPGPRKACRSARSTSYHRPTPVKISPFHILKSASSPPSQRSGPVRTSSSHIPGLTRTPPTEGRLMTRTCQDFTISQPQACLLYMLIANNCLFIFIFIFYFYISLIQHEFPIYCPVVVLLYLLFGFRHCDLFSPAVLFWET